MPTLFPGSDDSFTEPAAPSSTALDDDGGSGREHDENHQDIVDAIMAMQAEATLLVHSHNGSTARHGNKLAQANTHQNADTDSSTSSIHHTIDAALTNPNKAAAANHSHGSTNPWPVGAIFIAEVSTNPASLGLPGTWTAITSAFLVAAGSTFTGGSTGGATTHSHSHTFSSGGSHTHTPTATAIDNHYHTHEGGIGYSTFSHYHYMSVGGSGLYIPGGGSNLSAYGDHEHDGGVSSGSNHTHSPPGNTGFGGFHGHDASASSTNSNHTHTVSNSSSESNLPAYLPVYVWYRSA